MHRTYVEIRSEPPFARRPWTGFADAYAELAERMVEELGLRDARLPAGALGAGAIDTSRFEVRALLGHAGDLIASSRFDEARRLVAVVRLAGATPSWR